MQTELTVQELIEFSKLNGVSSAIKYAEEQYGEYPLIPKKPILTKFATSKEVFEYAESLAEWELKAENFKDVVNNWYENKNKINSIIISFIKEVAGISVVPEQYREKLYLKAWSDGHSDGFYEFYIQLQSLIEIFEIDDATNDVPPPKPTPPPSQLIKEGKDPRIKPQNYKY
jgi:hypothetical protein